MSLFYEIFPLFIFFIVFKWYGMYVATAVGIVITLLQLLITRIWQKKWDKKQLFTLVVFLIFGGMTLYFHNPIFIKWKPTIIFWAFGLVVLISQFMNKTITERLMSTALEGKHTIPIQVWKNLNALWFLFFLGLGGINLFFAYHFSNEAWVNFKFYGIISALLLFSVVQALYLIRYMRT